MAICKLCKINEATQTGSHIIPSFLMKRVDNVAGKTARDNELGFYVTDHIVKPYFGQRVLPGKLEEIFGNITEEDIATHRSPDILDHILCPDCEKRFGFVESKYSDTLQKKQTDSYSTEIDKNISFALWMSIIWRISIAGNYGIKLSYRKEENLRRLLNDNLNLATKTVNDLKKPAKQFALSYRLLRCIDYTEKEGGFVYCKLTPREPIAISIGEFILFIYARKKRKKDKGFSFFGFEEYKSISKKNNLIDNESVFVIDEDSFKNCVNNFVKHSAKIKGNGLFKQLDYIHTKLNGVGKQMPLEMKKNIIEEMINNNTLARRFNIKSMSLALYNEVRKNIELYPDYRI